VLNSALTSQPAPHTVSHSLTAGKTVSEPLHETA